MLFAASPTPESVSALLPAELAARLEAVDLTSRKLLAGKLQGERRSKRRGRSVEFDDYREYIPGDDLRHIDWNVLARLDRLFIKLFQEEEDLSLDILLDCSPSMHSGSPTKLFYAAQLACALGHLALVHNNRVSVTCFGSTWQSQSPGPADQSQSAPARIASTAPSKTLDLRRLEPLRGRRNTQRLVRFVLDHAFVTPPLRSSRTPARLLSDAVRSVAMSARAGRGLFVVLSDVLIPPEPGTAASKPLAATLTGSSAHPERQSGVELALGTLAAACGRVGAPIDAYLLQILTPQELDPSPLATTAGGRTLLGDLRLTDAETGRAAEVTVTEDLLTAYRQAMKRYTGRITAYCNARGISHLVVPTDTDIAALILGLLRTRGLVG